MGGKRDHDEPETRRPAQVLRKRRPFSRRTAADDAGRQTRRDRGPVAVDGRAIRINPGAAPRPPSSGVLIPPHFQPSRQSCAARGRADKPQRGEQAGIPGRGQPQQGEATPSSAPPATMLRPNQRLTARQRPAHAGTSVHVPAHGDQRCPSLIAAWPHPTLASRRSGPPARTRSPDQELPLAGPAQRAHTTTPELGCGQARTRARITRSGASGGRQSPGFYVTFGGRASLALDNRIRRSARSPGSDGPVRDGRTVG